MDQASIKLPAKKSPACAKRYSEHEREQILQDYHLSGLSPYRYCRDKSVTRETLIKWLGISPKKKKRATDSSDVFFKIQMNGSAQSPMIIRLPYDCSIEIYHPRPIFNRVCKWFMTGIPVAQPLVCNRSWEIVFQENCNVTATRPINDLLPTIRQPNCMDAGLT